MDYSYRPQSPDLSSFGLTPQNLQSETFDQHQHQQYNHIPGTYTSHNTSTGPLSALPRSLPQQYLQTHAQYGYNYEQPTNMARAMKKEAHDHDWLPDASTSIAPQPFMTGDAPMADPTLGVHLKTSFPVARIKRIMQADEDIGKVAQVTPHVVSRALEVFMIRLIAASAQQAKGVGAGNGAPQGKGPKKVQAQHMKRAIQTDENFDFLSEIAGKVPDAPSKTVKKQDADSDTEDLKPKKKAASRKKKEDSGDDF